MAKWLFKHFPDAAIDEMLKTAIAISKDPDRIREWESEGTRTQHGFVFESFQDYLEELNCAIDRRGLPKRRIRRTQPSYLA